MKFQTVCRKSPGTDPSPGRSAAPAWPRRRSSSSGLKGLLNHEAGEAPAPQGNVPVEVLNNKEAVCSFKPAGNADVALGDATEQICARLLWGGKTEALAAVFLNGRLEPLQQCSFQRTGWQLGSSASFMLE